jgi:hypothetical protein
MLSLIKAESPWEAEMLYYNRIGTFDVGGLSAAIAA